jgi:hypothetical protein
MADWGTEQTRVAMTLYTDAFVIQGTLPTRQRRLSDILNFSDEEFLVLDDAVLQGLGPHAERHTAPNAQVNLAAVLFAVASGSVIALPELRTPKVAETTLISIPPFNVTGHIHLMPERDVREALQELHGRFVPVTDATFWSDTLGEAARSAPMIAVNHARAQILSPYGKAPAGRPASASASASAPEPAGGGDEPAGD